MTVQRSVSIIPLELMLVSRVIERPTGSQFVYERDKTPPTVGQDSLPPSLLHRDTRWSWCEKHATLRTRKTPTPTSLHSPTTLCMYFRSSFCRSLSLSRLTPSREMSEPQNCFSSSTSQGPSQSAILEGEVKGHK